MSKALRTTSFSIDEAWIGFKPSDIRTRSIRSGAAMLMYLAEVPVYTIILIGRWSTDDFLKYIRKQVEQFSHNMSRRMIQNQYFSHVPDFVPTVSRHDPRQQNHRNYAQSLQNMCRAGTGVLVALPQMVIWT